MRHSRKVQFLANLIAELDTRAESATDALTRDRLARAAEYYRTALVAALEAE